MFTYGYGYNKYFHISESGGHSGDNITIRFLVRARSDAHLLLSSAPSPVEGQAVYEVVLGAGRNTFSDIRRLRRSSTKATARTVDILSPVELRGFWVHVSYKGDIQVGKEGDDVPFLFWTDPTPLPVLYFSFCTWTGVVGKWLYDCPIANDTEKIELVEPKPATMTEKLRKDLLSNYNPYALPVLHEDHRVAVFMHLTFHHVRLDVKRSVFSVDGIMPMHWMDEKMHWKPEDYGGLKSVHVNEHEVWVPEIVLYNAVGHGANILGHAGMTITSDGTVMWSPSVHLEAWCNLNLDRWPKDEHTCELQLGFWSQQQFLELIPGNDTVMEDEQRTGSEWEVIKMESETIITQNPWSQDVDIIDLTSSTSGTLTIRITVRRQNHPHTTMLVTPLLVVSALIFLSFWMSPLGADRLSVLCACLVLLSLFTITIGNILPAPAEHVPCLVPVVVVFVVVAFVFVFFLFFFFIIISSSLFP
ncbi:hypothetical protein ANN_09975 [Periplaneta americana]|uniref:Uncharacterized protein n=1 Tax=Periplaneta americana TaxID=6978 RepID=A0ABQ8TQG0_PERAM|nr:hypothetical protein ANN_09975 [Periplaneta americana]